MLSTKKSIDVNVFKKLPNEYITVFITSMGDLVASNVPKPQLRTLADDWYFKDVDNLELRIIEKGYNTDNWQDSVVSRPSGVIGRETHNNVDPIRLSVINGLLQI